MKGGIAISTTVEIPKGLDASDFDRKVIMKGIMTAARGIRKQSKQYLNRKGAPSKGGEYPARQTGRMWRAVKVHRAKRRDKFWARVQIDSISNTEFWYPASLMYGSQSRNITARKDAIWAAQEDLDDKNARIIENAMRSALKGWF